MRLTHIREGSPLHSVLIQMLISTGSSLTDTPTTMFNQASGHLWPSQVDTSHNHHGGSSTDATPCLWRGDAQPSPWRAIAERTALWLVRWSRTVL